MSGDQIVILGGGPAGLGAAWKLAERGHDVTVLESEEQVGGQSRTIRRGDWRFDLGGHRFFSKYPDVSNEIEQLIGEDRLVPSRRSVIRLNNQWIHYPLEAQDLLSRMSPLVTFRAGLDYLRSAVRCQLWGYRDNSFEDWVINRFGRKLYEIYFGIYTEKLWGIPPTEISADWAAQRISLINLWDVFVRLFRRSEETPRTYLTRFIYPRWGIGTITDRIAEKIKARGGRILVGCRVHDLLVLDNQVTGVRFLDNDGAQQINCDHVISTIPLPELVKALGPKEATEKLRLTERMRFRSLRFLNLAIDLPSISENTWIYVPERKYLFFRVQEPRNWSPMLAPAGRTSLILELACNQGDPLWREADDRTLARCIPQLVELGLIRPDQTGAVVDCFSTFLSHAYPVYDLTYRQKIEAALQLCDSVKNLVTLGRQGLFRYNNMDHSLKMAFLAADHWGDPELNRKVREVATDERGFESRVSVANDQADARQETDSR